MLRGKVTILKADKIRRQQNDLMPGRVSGAARKELVNGWRRWGNWGDSRASLKQTDSVGYNQERRKFTALGLGRKRTAAKSHKALTLCQALFRVLIY